MKNKKNHTRKIRGYKRKIRLLDHLLQYYMSRNKEIRQDRDDANYKYQQLLHRLRAIKQRVTVRDPDSLIFRDMDMNVEYRAFLLFMDNLAKNEDFTRSIKLEILDDPKAGCKTYEYSINILAN